MAEMDEQLKVLQIHARICLYTVQRKCQQKNATNATVPVGIVQLYHVVSYFDLFRFLSAMPSKQNISSIGSAVFDRIFCCNLPFHRHQLFNRWSACLWVGSPTNPV